MGFHTKCGLDLDRSVRYCSKHFGPPSDTGTMAVHGKQSSFELPSCFCDHFYRHGGRGAFAAAPLSTAGSTQIIRSNCV